MKKILFFINSLGGGGAEKVLTDLANALPENEYDVTVISLLGGVNESAFLPKVKYKKIIKSENPFTKKLKLAYFAKLMPSESFYKKYIKGGYDIEVAFLEGFNTKIIASSNEKGAKKIAFVHINFDNHYGLEGMYGDDKNALRLYEKFDTTAFVSERAKEGFENKLGKIKNGRVVHNIIDVEKIRSLSRERQEIIAKSEKPNLVSVGRLASQKGYDRLLECVKRLNADGLDFNLYIIGEGNEKEKLESFISDNGLGNVKLIPFQKNPYKLVAAADLFVCSSREEGYSTAVTEAAVLGVPVITTDCSGMDEIFDGGKYGCIVNNDTDSLYLGLKALLTNGEKYKELRQKAAERMNFYNKESCLEEYRKIF